MGFHVSEQQNLLVLFFDVHEQSVDFMMMIIPFFHARRAIGGWVDITGDGQKICFVIQCKNESFIHPFIKFDFF